VQAEYDFNEIKRAMMHPAEVLGEKQVINLPTVLFLKD
jgi:hypothetical protein